MISKIFFKGPYFPKHEDNLMNSEGDVSYSREFFLKNRFQNLDYLLESRYSWMNKFIGGGMNVIEIGSGAGFGPLYIKEKIILTDAAENDWIDKYIDATNMELEDNSVDIIIASHTIHHFYNPAKFFNEANRVLKKNGKILISEINTSFFMRLLLKVMKHEGYSYNVNVFSTDTIVNDKNDLWSANCAVPELLFSNSMNFENYFKNFKIILNEVCEFSIFPASGGVIAKTRVPWLPKIFLKSLSFIDSILIFFFPSIFALGRRVVLIKK